MTPAPSRRWFRFAFSLRTLFVVVTVFGTVGLFALYCASPATVSTTLVAADDGSLLLDVQKNFKVNSLYGIELRADGDEKPLWQLPFSETPRSRASIRLHDGDPADAGQMSRRLRPGEVFSVRVHCQYDTTIPPAACGGGMAFRFRISPDRHPEFLGTAPW